MPQLNPSPWFLVSAFSWFILLTLMPVKVLTHSFPQKPSTLTINKSTTKSWKWPWH